jgi:hypothetical protein
MNRLVQIGGIATAAALLMSAPAFAGSIFTTGNLVVSVEGCGIETGLPGAGCAGVANGIGTGSGNSSLGGYGDNQAAPLSLFQFTTTGTYVNSLVLPQTSSGANLAVSGEYGSSSEGTLQLSGNGQYLTIMGYGINANTFNAAYAPGVTTNQYGAAPSGALAQSGSLTGQSYTPVARVAALIDSNGNVNSSTAVYNFANTNNPRSAYAVTGTNGTNIYISGQGASGDATGGVFVTRIGTTNNSPTSITGADAGSGASQDTRVVQVYNGQLYVSADSKSGATNRSYLGTLGTGTPTTTIGAPTQLPSSNNASPTPVAVTSTGKLTLTAGETNGINSAGQQINLSPESYFFANSTTLYVADSGDGKQTSATSTLGDGGLQKWSLVGGTWELDYTLAAGLGLVENTASNSADTDGTTGLLGLAGMVVGGQVELFATNYTLSDLDQTYLYGITDTLSATTLPAGEMFTELAAAPADSNFKGVAFAPTDVTPEPGSFVLLALGLGAGLAARDRKALPK